LVADRRENRDHLSTKNTTGDDKAQLDLRSSAVGPLALGLLQAARSFSANSKEFSGQPLEMTGAGLITSEDGRVMLKLVLDGSLRVVVHIPDLAIPSLHECLFAMDEIRDGQAVVSASATQH
jgi:hypothetical protein